MRKLREIARLRFEAGRTLQEIASAVGVVRSTVQLALRRLTTVGLSLTPLVTGTSYAPFGPLTAIQFSPSGSLTLSYDADYGIEAVGGSALALDLQTDALGGTWRAIQLA